METKHYSGLNDSEVQQSRKQFGENIITPPPHTPLWKLFLEKFKDPIIRILLVAAVLSLIISIMHNEYAETIGIFFAIFLATGVGFWFEMDANKKFELLNQVNDDIHIKVLRNGNIHEIPKREIVVGDIVVLETGEEIPADGESTLTGEPVIDKTTDPADFDPEATYPSNKIMRGTTIVNGHCVYKVEKVGDATEFGKVAQKSTEINHDKTPLSKQLEGLAKFISIIGFTVAGVTFVGLLTKDIIAGIFTADTIFTLETAGRILKYFMVAVTLIVVSVPEGLPMSVTLSLALSMRKMLKTNNLVRKMHACETMGATTVICTDKTGTLTQDEIVLEYPLDIHGDLDLSVLRRAYLNSYFQTGLKNLMDRAIISRTEREAKKHDIVRDLDQTFHKIDELPFDFERRRMSVIVQDTDGFVSMVTKGALEEMLSVSNYVEYKGDIIPLTDDVREEVLAEVAQLNEQGLRVLGVSYKSQLNENDVFSVEDESDMILTGYLAFLDPPKPSAAPAIKALAEYGVTTKILTGDNDKVTQAVCEKVGLDVRHILLGSDLDTMSDQDLAKAVETTTVFAKLSPDQKARIILSLKENGHKVGYMGDGINDAPSMKVSDVGISVDTAVDIAKETADVILLDKDLMVLEKGLVEGRKVYANMTKYIKMTVSSNFGNIFSLLFASIFLPFLPMAPVHLIVLNLVYDISCIALPFDNVDKEFLKEPHIWEAKSIMRFMAWIGPISSVFDILTYILLYFIIVPMILGHGYVHGSPEAAAFIIIFQTGWFIESMWSQTMVIHMLRSPKLPFIQSHPALSVVVTTLFAAFFVTSLPYSPLASLLKLSHLNGLYFILLFIIITLYMLSVTFVKHIYIKKYKEWL